MLFDQVIQNERSEAAVPVAADDDLELTWLQCFRRAHSCTTRAGRRVRILLPPGVSLRHGDVLSDGKSRLRISIATCDVLVIKPADGRMALTTALGLGNLHAPVQCNDDELITLPDGPIEELLNSLGVPYKLERRRFEPETVAAPIRAQLAADFQTFNVSARR